MPAGSKALYAGSFILRLPCRASRGELGLINNYASSALSLSLSLFLFSRLLVSLLLFLLCLSHSLSLSLLPFIVFFVFSTWILFYPSVFLPPLSLLFSPPPFLPLVTDAVKANPQQRVRGRKPGRVKIKSELICHEQPSAFFIHRGLSDGFTPTVRLTPDRIYLRPMTRRHRHLLLLLLLSRRNLHATGIGELIVATCTKRAETYDCTNTDCTREF